MTALMLSLCKIKISYFPILRLNWLQWPHMSAMTSQIAENSTVHPIACSGHKQGEHQNSTLLVLCEGIHHWPADSPYKGPVMQKAFPCHNDFHNDYVSKTNHTKIKNPHSPQFVLGLPINTRNFNLQYLSHQWLSARLQYLQCVSNEDTAALHLVIERIHNV